MHRSFNPTLSEKMELKSPGDLLPWILWVREKTYYPSLDLVCRLPGKCLCGIRVVEVGRGVAGDVV